MRLSTERNPRTWSGEAWRRAAVLVVLLVLTATGCERAVSAWATSAREAAAADTVVILQQWRGVVERSGSERDEPATFPSHVADSQSLRELWDSLERGDSPPDVDFDESLMLVAVVTASSGVRLHPTLDGEGDLRRNVVALPIPNPRGWEYALVLIERDRVKSVEGEAVGE